MDLRDYVWDLILIIIMVSSTLILVLRLWQDLTIVLGATLMMLSLGGLFLSLGMKIRSLEENIIARERTMRVNLEEISVSLNRKYDRTVEQLGEIVDSLTRRMYR
ncbi:MAG: hypothetical protein XE11_1230 [Methanomicrobiales archaeon 53_19]|jgi:hypothetical protein|uniref:hypothetical protein n=1 Tax=Methanocalculus sp. TaxID=2004547 RepID=UPI000748C239|nr:hypothetical protein [Methanocalculus sp.]KUK68295.1 MAG: hypothetical protein XD88_1969 [Methanocalculus sp. 52_23]KUL03515.1 MAG: hypothetical protein XE11_1230 [Methanomicrobiales archaeon 53_19]HIJ06735.1 hypothetical protein [Methanocalculus sp.]